MSLDKRRLKMEIKYLEKKKKEMDEKIAELAKNKESLTEEELPEDETSQESDSDLENHLLEFEQQEEAPINKAGKEISNTLTKIVQKPRAIRAKNCPRHRSTRRRRVFFRAINKKVDLDNINNLSLLGGKLFLCQHSYKCLLRYNESRCLCRTKTKIDMYM